MNKDTDNKVQTATKADQNIYLPIKSEERVKWPTMLMIFVGMWVSMYSVNLGMAVGQSMSVAPAIGATILGYAIAGVFAAFLGDVGQRTGLSSYVLAKCPLGSVGQIIIAVVMFITIGMGSIGLQADTVARTITNTFTFIEYNPILSGLVCSIMMVSAVLGVKYMGVISWIAMPFFFIISIFATFSAIGEVGGLSTVMAIERTGGFTFSEAVFLNAGAWAGFVMLMPDVSRFLKKRSHVYTVIPVAFVIGSVPPVCGVLLGATLGQSLDSIFVALGFSVFGLISIVGIGWTTNDNNAYTAGLALNTALYPFKKISRSKVTIIVGVVGTIGAMLGIGNLGFITWISGFHGSFNMSFVGVLIAHFFVVSRQTGTFVQTKGVAGISAWLISGILTYMGVLPVPVITNTLLAFVLYLAFYYGIEKRIWGQTVVNEIVPPDILKKR